ncbi:hypothetical protein F2Q69_00019566 [Brassica cretica]|uniref:Uncharacterized protein n=1 Tax=Brassica cretica TaxID=69181 RepID=A0A8S9QQL4_BRACR|nr:hypothetical protein F2Q69_00019566 [Brassica cretica]
MDGRHVFHKRKEQEDQKTASKFDDVYLKISVKIDIITGGKSKKTKRQLQSSMMSTSRFPLRYTNGKEN